MAPSIKKWCDYDFICSNARCKINLYLALETIVCQRHTMGLLSGFIMHHFSILCTICAHRMAFPKPYIIILELDTIIFKHRPNSTQTVKLAIYPKKQPQPSVKPACHSSGVSPGFKTKRFNRQMRPSGASNLWKTKGHLICTKAETDTQHKMT